MPYRYDTEEAQKRKDWVLKHIVEHGDGPDGIVEKRLKELTKVSGVTLGNCIWKLYKGGFVFFDKRFVNRSRMDTIIRPTGKAIRWYKKNKDTEDTKKAEGGISAAAIAWSKAVNEWHAKGSHGPIPTKEEFGV
jgi:hypothetical protein